MESELEKQEQNSIEISEKELQSSQQHNKSKDSIQNEEAQSSKQQQQAENEGQNEKGEVDVEANESQVIEKELKKSGSYYSSRDYQGYYGQKATIHIVKKEQNVLDSSIEEESMGKSKLIQNKTDPKENQSQVIKEESRENLETSQCKKTQQTEQSEIKKETQKPEEKEKENENQIEKGEEKPIKQQEKQEQEQEQEQEQQDTKKEGEIDKQTEDKLNAQVNQLLNIQPSQFSQERTNSQESSINQEKVKLKPLQQQQEEENKIIIKKWIPNRRNQIQNHQNTAPHPGTPGSNYRSQLLKELHSIKTIRKDQDQHCDILQHRLKILQDEREKIQKNIENTKKQAIRVFQEKENKELTYHKKAPKKASQQTYQKMRSTSYQQNTQYNYYQNGFEFKDDIYQNFRQRQVERLPTVESKKERSEKIRAAKEELAYKNKVYAEAVRKAKKENAMKLQQNQMKLKQKNYQTVNSIKYKEMETKQKVKEYIAQKQIGVQIELERRMRQEKRYQHLKEKELRDLEKFEMSLLQQMQDTQTIQQNAKFQLQQAKELPAQQFKEQYLNNTQQSFLNIDNTKNKAIHIEQMDSITQNNSVLSQKSSAFSNTGYPLRANQQLQQAYKKNRSKSSFQCVPHTNDTGVNSFGKVHTKFTDKQPDLLKPKFLPFQ